MLKQNKRIDESTLKLIGLVILILLVSYYFYKYPKKHATGGLLEVTGVIEKTPEYSDGGVDNPPYIIIYLKNEEMKFVIMGCALRAINYEMILDLSTNDTIIFKVKQNDLKKPTTFLNNSVSVLGIKLPDKGEILNIGDLDYCEHQAWKRILGLLPFMGIIFLVILLFKVKR